MPIHLGQLEIHAELNEICGPAGRRRLEPQAVAVLELLVAEPGRAWSREELLDRAWPGRVVSDATLTGVISRLRRTLADAGIADIRIETRSKRGYVIVQSAPLSPSAAMPATRHPFARTVWGLLSVVLLAGLGFGVVHSDMLRSEPDSLNDVWLDFDITFPDGETSNAVIRLDTGTDGRISLSGDHPLDIRVVPASLDEGLLRLRIEAAGLAHWTGFEQAIGLGTESHFILKSETANAVYSIRFVASLEAPAVLPQEIPR